MLHHPEHYLVHFVNLLFPVFLFPLATWCPSRLRAKPTAPALSSTEPQSTTNWHSPRSTCTYGSMGAATDPYFLIVPTWTSPSQQQAEHAAKTKHSLQ